MTFGQQYGSTPVLLKASKLPVTYKDNFQKGKGVNKKRENGNFEVYIKMFNYKQREKMEEELRKKNGNRKNVSRLFQNMD